MVIQNHLDFEENSEDGFHLLPGRYVLAHQTYQDFGLYISDVRPDEKLLFR